MRTDITRQPLGLVTVQFLLLLVLFWARFDSFPLPFEPGIKTFPNVIESATDGMEGYRLPGEHIDNFLGRFPFSVPVAALLILLVNAFLITRLISRNLVFPARTYIPALFYITACCGIYFPAEDIAAMLASYLILAGSAAFISSFVRTYSFGTSFKGALLLGICPLLVPQYTIFLLLLPIAMGLFRRSARETIVALIGIFLPVFAAGYIHWAAGGDFTAVFLRIGSSLAEPGGMFFTTDAGDILRIVAVSLMVLLLFVSTGNFFIMSSDMRTRAYKIQVFMLCFLLVGAFAMILPSRTVSLLPAISIPVAFIAPVFFIRSRGGVPAVAFALLILSSIVLNIYPFFPGLPF